MLFGRDEKGQSRLNERVGLLLRWKKERDTSVSRKRRNGGNLVHLDLNRVARRYLSLKMAPVHYPRVLFLPPFPWDTRP